jgi:tight adherence protein C
MTTPALISTILFIVLMAGISYVGYRRYAKPGRILAQLGSPVAGGGAQILAETQETEDGGVVRVLRHIGGYVPVSPESASSARRLLIHAGYRSEHSVAALYGIKVLAAAALVLAAILLRGMVDLPAKRIMMIVAGAGMGFVGPAFLLEKKVKSRQQRLRCSLPDLLDLMVVSVEAGLGLDQAILHVSRELQMAHPELCEEWSLVNLEMRAGKRRSDALRNLAERTGEPELRKLVAILVQNDRFGTSMAEALRSHSDFMRTRRRQDAEERAGKVGVKLVFPIFFFVLPAMMIVTAGPAILQLVKQLFPLMRAIK